MLISDMLGIYVRAISRFFRAAKKRKKFNEVFYLFGHFDLRFLIHFQQFQIINSVVLKLKAYSTKCFIQIVKAVLAIVTKPEAA